MYERAEAKGNQALLKFRANYIADYEAFDPIHFWRPEPEPKYIYYIGQSKNYETWYKNVKEIGKDPIYKDLEEKSIFTKFVFKISNYDHVSIWKYEEIDDIDKKIQDFDVHVKELCKKLNDIQDDKTKKEKKDQLLKKLINL